MPFASALSEHPVASEAVGEVVGAVLERLGERPDLVVVTVNRPHAGALEDIVATVAAVLRPLAVIGAAAEWVVGSGRAVAATPAVNLWAGLVGPLAPVRLTATHLADGTWHFEGWPDRLSFDPNTLVLVADPFSFPTAAFLPWLAERRPGLPVVGGNASGGRGPGGSRLAVGGRVVTDGATGVVVGRGVEVETVVSHGCHPYGEPLTVTRSDRNILYEVAGLPAMECLVEQIGRHLDPTEVAALETHGLFVGRLVDERLVDPLPTDYLVRSVVGVDRVTGAVAVDDRIPPGSTIRFHRRDARSADLGLNLLLEGRRADAALVFSGPRGTRPFDEAHLHAQTLSRSVGSVPVGSVPVGGLSASGAFGPVGGCNFVHPAAASVALLRSW